MSWKGSEGFFPGSFVYSQARGGWLWRAKELFNRGLEWCEASGVENWTPWSAAESPIKRSPFFSNQMIPAPNEECMKIFRDSVLVLFDSFCQRGVRLLPSEIIWIYQNGPKIWEFKAEKCRCEIHHSLWRGELRLPRFSKIPIATPLPNLSTKGKDTLIRKRML